MQRNRRLMCKQTFWLLGLISSLVFGSLAIAGKPTKPGDGGGDSGSVPPGRISYQRSERVQYWFGWSRNFIGCFSMLGDGRDKQLEPDRFGEPSYARHAGHRWTLNSESVEGTNALGWERQELVATDDDGMRLQLTDNPSMLIDWPIRWAKDDSFLSFVALTVDPAETGEGNYIDYQDQEWIIDDALYVADVDWTSCAPMVGTLRRVLDANTPLPESGYHHDIPYPQIVYCDWSPDGNQLVSERRVDGYSGPPEMEVTTFAADGSITFTQLGRGRDPEWSPVSDRIAFAAANSSLAPDLVLWSIQSDGNGLRQLTTTSQDAHYRPKWSPDGNYIAFLRQKQSNQRGSSDWIDSIFRVSAGGGSITNLTSDIGDDEVWLNAWR